MNARPAEVLTATAAFGTAAAGGMMFVFSTFVMRGLHRIDPVEAITAMGGINAEANANPAFLFAYFGAAILAAAVGVVAVTRLRQPGAWWLLVGALFGIVGAIVTMAFNVPLNNHLDDVNPAVLSAGDATREWQAYASAWTAWNHVRTTTAFTGAALMITGCAVSTRRRCAARSSDETVSRPDCQHPIR